MGDTYFSVNESNVDCEIVWAVKGKLSRPVVKRSNHRVTYKYPSWKPKGENLQAESKHELNTLIIKDVDPSVTYIQTQPALLRYVIAGYERKHYPDIYVETTFRKIFYEVKPNTYAKDNEFEARTRYLSMVLPILGYEYQVITEYEISREPRLSNSKFLIRYGRNDIELIEREQIRKKTESNGYLSWGDIVNGCFGYYSVSMICRLILEGELLTNIENEWQEDTKVFLKTMDEV